MPSSGVQTCALDRKSTRLNSSHRCISYAVFCLKKYSESTAHHLSALNTRKQAVYNQRREISTMLEKHYRDIQDFEFIFFYNKRATPETPTLPPPGPPPI